MTAPMRWLPLCLAATLGCSGGQAPAAGVDGGARADAPAAAGDAAAGDLLTGGPAADAAPADAEGADVASFAPPDAEGLERGEAGSPALLFADATAFMFPPTVFFCKSERPLTVNVTNVGGSDSGALAVLLEGAHPGRFVVEKDGCSGQVLASGDRCSLEIGFAPKEYMEGLASAQLVVAGAAGERTTTRLSGESDITQVDVFPVVAGFLDFGNVKVGATSAVREETWMNNTPFPAMPMAAQLMSADFAIISDGCGGKTIAPKETCRIGVQMRPTAVGERFASILMTATGACGYDFTDGITLLGYGE